MVAVGLLAARLGGRALWLVSLAFVSMMAAGGALAMAGMHMPFVEIGIALSVVVFGATVALGFPLPIAAAMALVGAFALLHGHAHGAEMPEAMSGLAYGVGFVLATAALQAAGVALGLAIGRLGEARGARLFRACGSVVGVVGITILAGAL
jgi:urease accessory protein